MNDIQPLVFLGSSSERLYIAEAIQDGVRNECEPWVWNQGVFRASQTAISSLIRAIREKQPDFAVFVICGEDLTESRGVLSAAPRDNIIFEVGLFMGALSPERVILVVDQDAAPKIPSDLLGLTQARFKQPRRGTIEASLGTACREVKKSIAELGLFRRPSDGKGTESDLQRRLEEAIGTLQDLTLEIKRRYTS
jgi:predicted nucleotide-binding protein